MCDYRKSISHQFTQQHVIDSANYLSELCHGLASESGWWQEGDKENPLSIPSKLALVHSEVSEAMEAHRKDLNDDHLPNRKGFEVELADAVIRIMDLAGAYDLDLGGAIAEKLIYNTQREDHKIENRVKENGKTY